MIARIALHGESKIKVYFCSQYIRPIRIEGQRLVSIKSS